MRKTLASLLAAAALVTGLTLPAAASNAPAPPAGFADLSPQHWAYAPVQQLVDAGVIAAVPGGQFRPTDAVKRSELLKMVLTARGIDSGTVCAGRFVDVPCTAWFAPYVETAFRMAITDGQSAESFAPNAAVTRQELFTVIVRTLGRRWEAENLGDAEISGRLSAFTDRREVAGWARPALALAVGEGIATGYADGTFRPGAVATRAEAAAAIARIRLAQDGAQTVQVDGRQLRFTRSLQMTATAFTTGEEGVGTETYTGITVRDGTVAVDPRVIPLGRLLYVEGYGYAIAADTGGAIKGEKIDLYVHDWNTAVNQFGVQSRKVWVLP